jgi:hypothetical protein
MSCLDSLRLALIPIEDSVQEKVAIAGILTHPVSGASL